MDELLGNGAATGPLPGSVRVVPGRDVAALRRAWPDSAIVALVGSERGREAVEARLAGADVVMPCAADAGPDEADLAVAMTGARTIAAVNGLARDQTRAAAHEFAGNSSAVAMVAHLLDGPDAEQRAGQLRRLASRGRELAWQAGRASRSGGRSWQLTDLVQAVGEHCREAGIPGGPAVRIHATGSVLVLTDPYRLAAALRELLDNAGRAGATTVHVHVTADPGIDGESGMAVLAVIDDGHGLPDGWAIRPFVSGWSPPGAGLALAELAEFAEEHGGTLEVRARPGTPGACAELRLPLVDAPTGAGDPDPAGDAAEPDGTLAAILEGIARRVPVEQSLEHLVATMERYLPDSVCSILLLDEDTATLRHGAGARLPAPYRAAIDGLRIGPLAGSCGTAAYRRAEVVVTDIATDRRWDGYRHYALPFGLRACWSRPIIDVDRGVVLGTFAVYHRRPWQPGRPAVRLVQRLTHVAAVAIGTAALHGQLVESEARFRSTFEATGMGIALVSPSGVIQDANAALTAMAGRPIVGEALRGLLVDDDAGAITDAMGTLLARPGDGGRLPVAEVRLRRPDRPDAETIWAAMSGSLIRGSAGEPRHFCIEMIDLTERRRAAQADREREAARAADRAKSELLTLVSHEVRTPLHAVMGFAQVLQGMQLAPEQQREAVGHILGAGRHLLQLINDLLDLTGAEAGQLHLDLESLSTRAAVAEAMDMVAGLADERSISLRTDAPAGDQLVRADRHRLRQVLLNLLGNAIKFTPPGGAVRVGIDGDGITVADTGDGIPAASMPLLFTPFHRAGNSDAEGSGLGLALSRRLMRVMDGDLLLVASTAGGTTFRLVLPEPRARLRPPDRSTISVG